MKKRIISWILIVAFALSMVPAMGIAASAEVGTSAAELAVENVHLGDSLMTLSYKVNDLSRTRP